MDQGKILSRICPHSKLTKASIIHVAMLEITIPPHYEGVGWFVNAHGVPRMGCYICSIDDY